METENVPAAVPYMPPRRGNLRRGVLFLHRWLGAITGLVVLVIGVSGGLLVFESEYDQWQHPELYPASGEGQGVSPGKLLAVARQSEPKLRVAGLLIPRAPGMPFVVHGAGGLSIYLDPTTGRILGQRTRGGGIFQTLIKIHVSLMQKERGRQIVTVATIGVLALSMTGIWLWWPLRIWRIRGYAGFRRWNLDLHSVAGLYSSLFLFVLAFTGLTIGFHERVWFQKWVHPLIGVIKLPLSPKSQPPPVGKTTIALDDAIGRAETLLPGARVVSVEMPGRPQSPFHLQLAFPRDRSNAGRSIVNLDQYTGEPLQVFNASAGSLGSRYLEMHLQLHTGTIGGLTTKIIAFLVCVALVLQVLSGYVLWWKRSDTPRVGPQG